MRSVVLGLVAGLASGCSGLELVGFDDVQMSRQGFWLRSVDETGVADDVHLFLVTSDPELDCGGVERFFTPDRYKQSDELEELRRVWYAAEEPGDHCRAELEYHRALDEQLGPRPDQFVAATLMFFSPEIGGGPTQLPPVGVTLGRTDGVSTAQEWSGVWSWKWDAARWHAEHIDCDLAEAGEDWHVPVPQPSGRMRGVLTVDETGQGYAADVALGFEDHDGTLVGSLDGRVRFSRCDLFPTYPKYL